ncbi:MAG: pantoate--beta-alanine ligase [Nitrospirae bacterium]|nr:pantoate--beta-alanine ligase [Nitrospirota bacterium]
MDIIKSVPEMRQRTCLIRQEGRSIGFVPTMGALHDGHLSLVARAKTENDVTVASIFVNPKQFLAGEDFDKYPRSYWQDADILAGAGVEVVFMPYVGDMYPEGFNTFVEVRDITERLCGAFRHGHFTGVATVVAKLFNIVKPRHAYFGLKDYQQYVVIRKMVRDLCMDVTVVPCTTVREPDGLAMSSRNVYLSAAERKDAPIIYKSMVELQKLLKANGLSAPNAPLKFRELLMELLHKAISITEIQYAGIFDPDTLREIADFGQYAGTRPAMAGQYAGEIPDKQGEMTMQYSKKSVLIAVALKMGSTRLIDNLLVELP